jgi:hypothetical protein
VRAVSEAAKKWPPVPAELGWVCVLMIRPLNFVRGTVQRAQFILIETEFLACPWPLPAHPRPTSISCSVRGKWDMVRYSEYYIRKDLIINHAAPRNNPPI